MRFSLKIPLPHVQLWSNDWNPQIYYSSRSACETLFHWFRAAYLQQFITSIYIYMYTVYRTRGQAELWKSRACVFVERESTTAKNATPVSVFRIRGRPTKMEVYGGCWFWSGNYVILSVNFLPLKATAAFGHVEDRNFRKLHGE